MNRQRFALAALCALMGLALLLGGPLTVLSARPNPQAPAGWRGEYYAGRDLIGAPVLVRDDRAPDGTAGIDHDWAAGTPAAALPADDFSARWTKRETFEGGGYSFLATFDGGLRLFVDGDLLIDEWAEEGLRQAAVDLDLAAGEHTLRVEYFDGGGPAVVRVGWAAAIEAPATRRGGIEVEVAEPSDDEGWQVAYYDNPDLSGEPGLERVHTPPEGALGLNLDWGARAPALGLPRDGFSVRWTRTLTWEPGLYRFVAGVDDGMRVWVDETLVLDEWRDGTQRQAAAEHALAAGAHRLTVEYYDRSGPAAARLHWVRLSPAAPGDPVWAGAYWDNPEQSGRPALERGETALAFEWGQGAPGAAIPADGFSARWTRPVELEGGTYRFYVLVDDGVRLRLDDDTLIDRWSGHDSTWVQADATLDPGTYTLQVDYLELVGDARIHVAWQRLAPLSFADWKGEYWANRHFQGEPALVRNDIGAGDDSGDGLGLAFDWGAGAPSPDLPLDGFSARWTRTVAFEGGAYLFYALADDGVRVWVDDQRLIDQWSDQKPTRFVEQTELAPGEHRLTVEYYEQDGRAQVRFWWERIDD